MLVWLLEYGSYIQVPVQAVWRAYLSWAYPRYISDMSYAYLRHISAVSQPYLRHISGISWAYLGISWAFLAFISINSNIYWFRWSGDLRWIIESLCLLSFRDDLLLMIVWSRSNNIYFWSLRTHFVTVSLMIAGAKHNEWWMLHAL